MPCGDGDVSFVRTTLPGPHLVNGVATLNKRFARHAPLTATYAGNVNFNGRSGTTTHQTN